MGFSIDDVSSVFNNTASQATNSATDALEGRLDKDMQDATDEELMSVCKEFEAYFMEQVYKEMQKTIPKNEEDSAPMAQLTDYYKDEMIQKVAAQSVEQGGNGLAQQLYEQMKRNYGPQQL